MNKILLAWLTLFFSSPDLGRCVVALSEVGGLALVKEAQRQAGVK
jgi:hypothetical protein